MSDDLNTSIALAQQFKNYFRAFDRAEEFLRSLAAAQSEAAAILERRDAAQREIAALEDHINALRAREAEARQRAEQAEIAATARVGVAIRSSKETERHAQESTKSVVEKYEAHAEAVIEELTRRIEGYRARRDEEKQRYQEAQEQRAALLLQLGG